MEEGKKPTIDTLKEWVEGAIPAMKELYLGDSFVGHVMMFMDDGRVYQVPCTYGDNREKQAFYHVLDMLITEHKTNLVGVLHVSDVFFVELGPEENKEYLNEDGSFSGLAVPPSEHPKRKDALSVLLFGPYGVELHGMFVLEEKDGKKELITHQQASEATEKANMHSNLIRAWGFDDSVEA